MGAAAANIAFVNPSRDFVGRRGLDIINQLEKILCWYVQNKQALPHPQ
jgi:hypothetical protein